SAFLPKDVDLTKIDLTGKLLISISVSGFFYILFSRFPLLRTEDFNESVQADLLRYELNELRSAVERSVASAGQVQGVSVTPHERAKLLQTIVQSSKINLTSDFINEIRNAVLKDEYYKLRDRMLRRLENQVVTLGARANYSLVWGITFAVFGIFGIYY